MRSNRTGPLMTLVLCAIGLLAASFAAPTDAVTLDQANQAITALDAQELQPLSCELAVECETAGVFDQADELAATLSVFEHEYAIDTSQPEPLLIERVACLLTNANRSPIDDDIGDRSNLVTHTRHRNIDVKLLVNTATPAPSVLLRI